MSRAGRHTTAAENILTQLKADLLLIGWDEEVVAGLDRGVVLDSMLDSLMMTELILIAEERFSAQLPADLYAEMRTVDDLVEWVATRG